MKRDNLLKNKFRGKVKYNGNYFTSNEWVFGSLILKTNGAFIYTLEEDELGNIVRELEVEVIPTTVGQYTGLKDKDGKEIYEGDQLFICAGYSCVVEFQDGMFVGVYNHPEDGEVVPLHEHDVTKSEIIHDNPELINQ